MEIFLVILIAGSIFYTILKPPHVAFQNRTVKKEYTYRKRGEV